MGTGAKYLSEMVEGEKGTVIDVETANCPERGRMLEHAMRHGGLACGTGCSSRWGVVKRLAELGLTFGARVTLLGSAQTDGTLEILVGKDRVRLGREFASRIIVETPIQLQDSSRES
jgi:Fe2+ transport system protein FeoA